MARSNVIGEIYNRMTVIKDAPDAPNSRMRRVIAQCSCGVIKEVLLASLKNGATKSCGCYHKEIQRTHGQNTANNKLYAVWAAMKDRCNNPKAQKYSYYGKRGISVCDEWVNSFETFNEWAIKGYKKGLSLDRIDNDKGYSPDNCRWTNPVIQSRNQRARSDGSSKYIGVHWNKSLNKWIAMIGLNGKKKHLGVFNEERDAAIARDSFIIKEGLTDFKMNDVI